MYRSSVCLLSGLTVAPTCKWTGCTQLCIIPLTTFIRQPYVPLCPTRLPSVVKYLYKVQSNQLTLPCITCCNAWSHTIIYYVRFNIWSSREVTLPIFHRFTAIPGCLMPRYPRTAFRRLEILLFSSKTQFVYQSAPPGGGGGEPTRHISFHQSKNYYLNQGVNTLTL